MDLQQMGEPLMDRCGPTAWAAIETEKKKKADHTVPLSGNEAYGDKIHVFLGRAIRV